MATKLWPEKTSSHLHFLLSAAERTCRAWASGETKPGAETFVALLWSSEGGRVLAHAMRNCKQQWWRDYQVGQICLAHKLRCDAEIQQLELQL